MNPERETVRNTDLSRVFICATLDLAHKWRILYAPPLLWRINGAYFQYAPIPKIRSAKDTL